MSVCVCVWNVCSRSMCVLATLDSISSQEHTHYLSSFPVEFGELYKQGLYLYTLFCEISSNVKKQSC